MAPSRTTMLAALAGACLASGCSGGGSGNATQPILPGGSTPTPTPAGAVSPLPSTLTFITTGSAAAQSVTTSETGYGGTFTITTTTCDGIVSISPNTTTSVFIVTPQNNGTCTITISGAPGESATLPVSVTLSGGTIQMRGRSAGR